MDKGYKWAAESHERKPAGKDVYTTFNEETGEVKFYSDGGTLDPLWIKRAGIDRDKICSIQVAEGNVVLPERASVYDDQHDRTDLLFAMTKNLKYIDMHGFDTSKMISMSQMFYGCDSLEYVDMSGCDMSKVRSMHSMFYLCCALKEVNVNVKTPQLQIMHGMFGQCYKLKKLNLNQLDTSNVTDMGSMFSGCISLAEVDLTNFCTGQVKNMNEMFYSCEKLKEIDIGHFDLTHVINMSAMFFGCKRLEKVIMKTAVNEKTWANRMFAYTPSNITVITTT